MYSLLLLNGGTGERVGAGQPKQLIRLRGLPILVYSLVVADAIEEISEIVLNYPPGWRTQVQEVLDSYPVKTPVTLIAGEATRQESVASLLKAATNERVLVHEAARPLVTRADFRTLIDHEHDNVALTLPLSFSVAPVDDTSSRITGEVKRDGLRNVLLPHKFLADDLRYAHERAAEEGRRFTEDASQLAAYGRDVYFVAGQDHNIKVTTPTDVRLATFLLGKDDDLHV